ncbi:MAG: Hsp70 family protein, partial [Symbiobacteriaceae bacterium]|nr:Hsp70 family protein [Symbiobacteriaceae bacterium]
QGFEELTHDLVARTISFVHKLLGEAAVAPEAVDVVLLVGGSTRMPMVRTAVEGIFPGKVRMEQPDLAVAKGAALAAAVEWNERIAELINETEKGGDIEEKAQELGIVTADAPPLTKEQARHLVIGHVPAVVSNFQDILSRSFGPAVFNHQGDYVIDNLLFVGDPNPSEATQTYGTLEAAQEIVEFYVFENVANDRVNSYVTPALDANEKPQHTDPALKVKTLGKVTLALPPNTPQGAPIEVFFRCSTLGLEVRAHNPQTGETVEVLLESGHTKTPEELAAEVQRFSGMRTKGEI